jgi:DNA polymerase III epsilon subunit-like protein
MTPKFPDLVFIAIQTTGSDVTEDFIVDIAIVAEDGTTVLNTAIAPSKFVGELPEELGYTKGDLAPSPLFEALALQILGLLTRPIIAGHDTQFSMRFLDHFLRESLEEAGEDVDELMGRLSTRFLDTVTLSHEQIGKMGLEEAMYYLRLPYRSNHSSLEDARASRTLYNTLSRANAWQRWWWKWHAPKLEAS